MLAQCQLGVLGELEQMAGGVFHLVQFPCSQIDKCLSKEQASSAVEIRRTVSQRLLQCNKCNVFLPAGLV